MLPARDSKRLIGYLRVSTDEQADSGAGLAAQKHALERAFEYEGWQLVEIVTDAGESGKDLNRAGLHRALTLIAAGQADGMVVAKLDRLTRSVVDFGDLLEWFDIAGATFVALDLRLDTSTPTGAMVAHVLVVVAEWERRTIGQRTKDAMAAKRAAGEATGRPSLHDRPELVALVQQLQAGGMRPSDIATELERRGIPTVRGGTRWRPSALQAVLGYQRPPRRRRRAELPPVPRRRT
jgi:DNA invertase Pin-like site-specific DNA recombinase